MKMCGSVIRAEQTVRTVFGGTKQVVLTVTVRCPLRDGVRSATLEVPIEDAHHYPVGRRVSLSIEPSPFATTGANAAAMMAVVTPLAAHKRKKGRGK
jgi:hypothetical protein